MATYDQRSGSTDRRLVASGSVHNTVVDATTANAGVESASGSVNLAGDDFFAGPSYFIRRACMEFDLTGVPSNAVISGTPTVKINFTGPPAGKDDDDMSVNLFYFTRASSEGGNFDANDFDEAKGTAASSATNITGLSSSHTFSLNAGSITDLTNNLGGYVQFSLRLSGDYTPSAPASEGNENQINGYAGNDTTESNRPRLEFTYTVPGGSKAFFM